MTRGLLSYQIRENLNDLGITYYNIDDLDDSIQDAYDEIVVYSQCFERYIDLTPDIINSIPEGAKPWLNMKMAASDYYRPIAILNMSNKRFLTPVFDRENDSYQFNWQIQQSSCYDFVVNGPEWIGFPGFYVGNMPLRVFYKAIAPQIQTDNDTLFVHDEYSRLFELYCTADLLEQNQEYTKATGYWTDYEKLLEEFRLKVMWLAKADRMFQRFVR